MRVVIFHCKQYQTKIEQFSNRPSNIKPEEIRKKEKDYRDCIAVLITVEKDDDIKKITPRISEEIIKASNEMEEKNTVLLPFAHLSNNLASSEKTIQMLNSIEAELKNKLDVKRDHFGSHKELLLDIYGHPGNARYREF